MPPADLTFQSPASVLVSREDPRYPRRLAEVRDAPPILYVRGNLASPGAFATQRSPVVAMVGSRAASGHALATARDLAHGLSREGALVVSGGAIGVDAAAHAGAVAAGAPTIVVLGTPLSNLYPPRHLPLFDRILRHGGALVTPFAPGHPTRAFNFPRRNRIMAAMADITIVIEASRGSGSLYTADAAIEYGRTLGACPGSPATETLLSGGAALIQSVEDVFRALAGLPNARSLTLPEIGTDEDLALRALSLQAPRDALSLGTLLGVEPVRAARALSALELEGLAIAAPGGHYLRSVTADRALA